jgi:hypothetical protein
VFARIVTRENASSVICFWAANEFLNWTSDVVTDHTS